MHQMNLPLSYSLGEAELKEHLERATGRQISLTITNNALSMISVKNSADFLKLRIHRIFLQAAPDVLDAIACFIKDKKKLSAIREFVRANKALLPAAKKKNVRLNPSGKTCNLRHIFEALNDAYFSGALKANITWGRASRRRAVRKRTLGSYCRATATIRINPLLDYSSVPRYYLEYVVYHEMLHAAMSEGAAGARRKVHTPAFRQREKLFEHYEMSRLWEKSH